MRAGADGHGPWLPAGNARVPQDRFVLLSAMGQVPWGDLHAASINGRSDSGKPATSRNVGAWSSRASAAHSFVAADGRYCDLLPREGGAGPRRPLTSAPPMFGWQSHPRGDESAGVPPDVPRSSASEFDPSLSVLPLSLRANGRSGSQGSSPVPTKHGRMQSGRRFLNSASNCDSASISPARAFRTPTVSRRPARSAA